MNKNLKEIISNKYLMKYRVDHYNVGDIISNKQSLVDRIMDLYKFEVIFISGIKVLIMYYFTIEDWNYFDITPHRKYKISIQILSFEDDYYLIMIYNQYGNKYYFKLDQVSELLKFLKILFS